MERVTSRKKYIFIFRGRFSLVLSECSFYLCWCSVCVGVVSVAVMVNSGLAGLSRKHAVKVGSWVRGQCGRSGSGCGAKNRTHERWCCSWWTCWWRRGCQFRLTSCQHLISLPDRCFIISSLSAASLICVSSLLHMIHCDPCPRLRVGWEQGRVGKGVYMKKKSEIEECWAVNPAAPSGGWLQLNMIKCLRMEAGGAAAAFQPLLL